MVCIFGCREDEPEFPFPKYERNPAMFMAWVQVLKGCINNKNLKNIKTYEDLRLCGKHFNTKDRVIINNVHHLLHTATPQHFLFRKLYSSEDRIIPQPKVSVPVNIDKIGSNLVLKNGSNAATKVNENGIVHLDPKDLEAGVYLKVDAPALPKQEKSSDPKPQAEGKTFRITSVEALRKMLKENVQGPVAGITIKKFPTEEVPIDAINTDSTELADPLFIDLKKSTPAKPQVEHNPSPQGARIINDDLMTTPSISNNKLYLKSLVTYGKPSSRNSKPVIVSNQIIKQANTKIHVLPLQQNHGAGVRVVPPQDGNTQNQDHHYFKKPVRLDESSLNVPLPTNVVYTPYKQPKRVTVFPPPPPNISNPAGAKADVQSRIGNLKVLRTKIRRIRSESTALKKKIGALEKRSKILRAKLPKSTSLGALSYVINHMTPAAKMFTIMQFKQNRPYNTRRFNIFDKMFTMALVDTSEAAYKLLARHFIMPAPVTIKHERLKHELNTGQYYEEMFRAELMKNAWEEELLPAHVRRTNRRLRAETNEPDDSQKENNEQIESQQEHNETVESQQEYSEQVGSQQETNPAVECQQENDGSAKVQQEYNESAEYQRDNYQSTGVPQEYNQAVDYQQGSYGQSESQQSYYGQADQQENKKTADTQLECLQKKSKPKTYRPNRSKQSNHKLEWDPVNLSFKDPSESKKAKREAVETVSRLDMPDIGFW